MSDSTWLPSPAAIAASCERLRQAKLVRLAKLGGGDDEPADEDALAEVDEILATSDPPTAADLAEVRIIDVPPYCQTRISSDPDRDLGQLADEALVFAKTLWKSEELPSRDELLQALAHYRDSLDVVREIRKRKHPVSWSKPVEPEKPTEPRTAFQAIREEVPRLVAAGVVDPAAVAARLFDDGHLDRLTKKRRHKIRAALRAAGVELPTTDPRQRPWHVANRSIFKTAEEPQLQLDQVEEPQLLDETADEPEPFEETTDVQQLQLDQVDAPELLDEPIESRIDADPLPAIVVDRLAIAWQLLQLAGDLETAHSAIAWCAYLCDVREP